MIFVKLYATLVIMAWATGMGCMIYSTITDDTNVGDFGVKTFCGAVGSAMLGFVFMLVVLLWA